MNYLIYLLRMFLHNLIWILLGTLIITFICYLNVSKKRGNYNVEATLYTGVISGYGIEDNNIGVNYAMAQNAIDNLINIISAESTLKRVSINLFAQVLVKGSPTENQNSITSESYNYTYNHMKNSPQGKLLVSLIDRNSIEKTVENFLKFETSSPDNYIHGLFYYNHPFYSINSLKRINVFRLGSSDLLEVKYSSSDPGIAYNTIEILMKEFVEEYRALRYGETDKVIEYFRSELNRIGAQLEEEENNLTAYNVQNRIINYSDETKEIAAINKEFELREQDIQFAYNSAKAMLKELERQMEVNERQALSSIQMLNKLKQASDLTGKISEMETIALEDTANINLLNIYRNDLEILRQELSEITQEYIGDKYNKNGLAKTNIIEQWLDQTLIYEKAKAELQIAENSRNQLNRKYERFAPIGTTIKQKERIIDFSERSYLANLGSYNEALMRKKNLEMTSAALKVLNPPIYPIKSESINRKRTLIITCLAAFLFFAIIVLIIEMLDRTLKDTIRTYKLIQSPIIGCIVNPNSRNLLNKVYNEEAIKYISNKLLSILTSKLEANKPYIINLIRIDNSANIDYLSEQLQDYWVNKGIKVELIVNGKNFNSESAEYLLANNITHYIKNRHCDIVIVVHPEYDESTIPTPLLKEAAINLLLLSSKHGWKSNDRIMLSNMEIQIGEKPFVCLTDAYKYDLENYVGMLPPYTPFRRIVYRFSQLSISEAFRCWKDYFKTNNKKKTKQLTITDNDDD